MIVILSLKKATVTGKHSQAVSFSFSCTHTNSKSSSTFPDIYLGCYEDHHNLLPNKIYSNTSNTIEMCITECKNKNFAFAGVQYG